MDKFKYSLEVYEDHCFINGSLTPEVLVSLIEFCKIEGFTHLANRVDGKPGFMLIKVAC